MKPLFARIKEVDDEAFEAFIELIANKQLAKNCNLDLTSQTLAGAFVWAESNRKEFFWEKVARKLGELPTPVFENPCDKYKKKYVIYD